MAINREEKSVNKKILAFVAAIIIAVSLPTILLSLPSQFPPKQQELDFTVTGTNTCLRFLDRNVSTGYVPFRTGANEKWNLTIYCSEMPTPNAWTDLYLYGGYWDKGTNHKCVSEDLYPILSQIESSEYRVNVNSTFTETFGGATAQSYTIFFIFPPSGPGTFHVKLFQVA
jgi:hypothetical protein